MGFGEQAEECAGQRDEAPPGTQAELRGIDRPCRGRAFCSRRSFLGRLGLGLCWWGGRGREPQG